MRKLPVCVRWAVVWSALIICVAAPSRAADNLANPVTLIVEEGTGDVSARELSAFKAYMQASPPPVNNIRNAMVYGAGASAAESLARVYQISGDVELLDRVIAFTDAMLASRNDPATGVMIWTGQRDPVWPNSVAEPGKGAYAGTETGEIVGHIAHAAKLILENKAIWQKQVPGNDPYHYGATYIERARTYIREMDRTVDAFVVKWIVSPDTLRYHFPDSSAYGDAARADAVNKPVPWNQQMMLNHGFQRLAECHAILADDPQRVKKYDAIVKTSIDWFFECVERCDVKGRPCYKWAYPAGEKPIKHYEDTAHAGFDLLGLMRAYRSGRYGVTKEMMTPFANTVTCVLAQPANKYMGRVDGTNGKHPPGGLGGYWIDLCEIAPDLYPSLYACNRGRIKSSPALAANFLFVKHRLHL